MGRKVKNNQRTKELNNEDSSTIHPAQLPADNLPSVEETVRQTKSLKKGQKKSEEQEFRIDLDVLDGYDLPNGKEKVNDEAEPHAKKPKRSRPEILGIDYREREEKRLEQILFGEVLEKFEQ